MVIKSHIIHYRKSKFLFEHIKDGQISYEQVPFGLLTNKIKKLAYESGGSPVLIYKSRGKILKIKKQKKKPMTKKQMKKICFFIDQSI